MEIAKNNIKLTISHPNKIEFDDYVYLVSLKTTNGYIAFQKNNEPMICNIDIGQLTIYLHSNKKTLIYAISSGILITDHDQVKIFTSSLVSKDKIDETRAITKKELLETKLKNNIELNNKKLIEFKIKKEINKITIKNNNYS